MTLKKRFFILLALFVPTFVGLLFIDSGLKTFSTPNGIVSFEFCCFNSTCEQTMLEWGVKGKNLAMLSLGLDYLFLVLYPSLICTGLLQVVAYVPNNLKKLTRFLAYFSLFAGLFDAIENYALIRLIIGNSEQNFGLLASYFATLKFLIFGITFLWLVLMTLKFFLLSRKQT